MSKGYFITGTDTGIGKTHVALSLMAALQQQGKTVCGMKPVSAGCQQTPSGLVNDDALKLIEQSSVSLPYHLVNPYAWEPAIAPHIAAQDAGCEMTLAPIRERYQQIASRCDMLIVEGAGGWLVPLNDRQTMAEIPIDLTLDVILVVGIRLGCLNHALLTAESIMHKGCRLAGWFANHIEPSMHAGQQNMQYLIQHIEAPLLGSFTYQPVEQPEQLAMKVAIDYLFR